MTPQASAKALSHNVSDDVWAQAVHAVKVQKLSLRQAAHMYGVHHMSLHRRVRGCYAPPTTATTTTSTTTTSTPAEDIRMYLSVEDEAEALGVLHEQFLHERRITADDIRFVVRAIASQGGRCTLPQDFPKARWIHDFKAAHGFAKLNHFAYPPCAEDEEDEDMEDVEDGGYGHASYADDNQQTQPSPPPAPPPRHPSPSGASSPNAGESPSDGDRDEARSNSSSATSHDTGATTGTTSSQNSSENGDVATTASTSTTNASASSHTTATAANGEKRTYQQSHTVPAETWAKAIAAVEQQGLSLRVAAKMYGVHFAALHRRVKKRAQGEHGTGVDEYFTPEREAGVVRVAVARAELGVPMSFDELMDLVQRAALRNLPDLSVNAARKLMGRFQSRNEHSIRQIITNWPLHRANARQGGPVIRVVNGPPSMPARVSPSSAFDRPASFPFMPPGCGGFPMSMPMPTQPNAQLGESSSSAAGYQMQREPSSMQFAVGPNGSRPPPLPPSSRNGNDAENQSRESGSRSASSSSRPIMFV